MPGLLRPGVIPQVRTMKDHQGSWWVQAGFSVYLDAKWPNLLGFLKLSFVYKSLRRWVIWGQGKCV